MRKYFIPFLSAMMAAALSAAPVRAAWYDFARNDSAPEIASLDVAGRQMEDLVEVLEVFPEELKGGKLVIRGKAETSRGKIGAVLVSVDGGKNFEKTKVSRGGVFIYSFSPVIDREYGFQVRALDTTGRSSDPKAGAFGIVVKPDTAKQEAVDLFRTLLDLYKAKDRGGFMAHVAVDFEGDRSLLEEGLEKDFDNLNSINIVPSITRVSRTGKRVVIYFSFNRKVQSRASGKTLTDRSQSSMSFTREGERVVLFSMSAPLIFGVAATADVATGVEFTSSGDKVLVVTDDGDALQVEQQESVNATADQVVSNIVAGSLAVTCNTNTGDATPRCQAVALRSRAEARKLTFPEVRHATMGIGEVSVSVDMDSPPPPGVTTGCAWSVEANSLIRDTGKTKLTDVKVVSSDENDYVQAIPADNRITIVPGRVYAVKTPELYALLQMRAGASCTHTPPPLPPGGWEIVINATFDYRIQLSQNPSFY